MPLRDERGKEVEIKELMDKAKDQSQNSWCIIHAKIRKENQGLLSNNIWNDPFFLFLKKTA